MSSFEIGTTHVDFLVVDEGFDETWDHLLPKWMFEVLLDNHGDYAALASLLCSMVLVRTVFGPPDGTGRPHVTLEGQGPGIPPPPSFPIATIGGVLGQGRGTLSIDNMGVTFQAALVGIGRGSSKPGGQIRARTTFQGLPT